MDALAKQNTTEAAIVANILAYYHRADEATKVAGRGWYTDERANLAALAAELDVAPELVAAVVAHTSPKMPWKRNLMAARGILTDGTFPMMSGPMNRAIGAIAAWKSGKSPLDTINGPKTRNFARNLLGDLSAVTVDVWACRVAVDSTTGGDVLQTKLTNKGVYEAVAACYTIAAAIVGETPADMQAITWVEIGGGK